MTRQKKRSGGLYQKNLIVGRKADGQYIRKTVYAKTLKELDQKVADITQQLNNGIQVWDNGLTFKELAEIWFNQYNPDASETWRYYQWGIIKKHLLPSLGEMKIRDIRQLHLQTIITTMSNNGNAIRISLPDSMQGNARKAWTNLVSMLPIDFKILIDGQPGDWYHGGYGLKPNDDGTLTFHIVDIRGLNLETVKDIKTVTLIPVLRYVTGFEGPDKAFVDLPLNMRTENPKSGDGTYMGQKFKRTEYPEYAITFNLG